MSAMLATPTAPRLSLIRRIGRDMVTPVTLVTFLVSTITGIMLLLHWNQGLVRASHEWLSLVFSAIAIWHLARNWRTFLGYLRRNLAVSALVAALAGSVVFTAMTASGSSASPGAVFRALSQAPLAAAAPAFGTTPEAALAKLRAAGIEAAPQETLAAIGARAGRSGAEMATLLARTR